MCHSDIFSLYLTYSKIPVGTYSMLPVIYKKFDSVLIGNVFYIITRSGCSHNYCTFYGLVLKRLDTILKKTALLISTYYKGMLIRIIFFHKIPIPLTVQFLLVLNLKNTYKKASEKYLNARHHKCNRRYCKSHHLLRV